MKSCSLIALFLQLTFIVSGQKLENQGFEQVDTSFVTGLKNWKSRMLYKVEIDRNELRSGQSSICLISQEGQTYGTFNQLMPLPKSNSMRKFRVSGFIKRDSVSEFSGIYVTVYQGDNTLFFDNMANKKLNGTADWMEVSTDFFADETADEIQIGGLVVGTGRAWFDDFSLVELPISSQPLPDSLRTYLDEALDTIQRYALNRDSANWPKVREQAFFMASGAKNYEDCYPAIQHMLGKLKDHHSFLMSAVESKAWSEPQAEAYKNMPLTTGEILDGNIAYLNMPAVNSGSNEANTYFANELHNLLEKLDQSKPKAWILDLRNNGGGNCWPMLAGIGPLLGEGKCGYFINKDGTDSGAWFYKKGRSGTGKATITSVSRKPYKLRQKQALLAVLTGPSTGSSGEVVTVAFRKRPNTRSFGRPTAGLSTGNGNYALRDGAQIFLTSSVYADRQKEAYGQEITPDEWIKNRGENAVDVDLEAAKAWLRSWD